MSAIPEPKAVFGTRQNRQIAWITAVAVAVFIGMRFLPTGTNLNHMDFRVSGQNAIEFCDPSNPQFIPVVSVKSPVTMTVRWEGELVAGKEAKGVVVLQTANGKVIESQDLLVAHTRKLHLLIVDPTLLDYQHVHPEPGGARGEWKLGFTPRRSGSYRVFADFTPAATGRGLYAGTEVDVAAGEPGNAMMQARPAYGYSLEPKAAPIRAGQPADLLFTISHIGGGVVALEPVMGAYAHLVAFDLERSGFAHLHPAETDLTKAAPAEKQALNFRVTIPREGRYAIWAQFRVDGAEFFTPFWFDVVK